MGFPSWKPLFLFVRVRVQAGQNGYRIATENNIPFETVEKEFETREHALNWIIENQLGRRNLNPNQIAYLRGKRYECEKKIVSNKEGANQHSNEVESHNGIQPDNNTSRKLGAEYGIGRNTVLRNARFSKVVDILPEEVKSSVLSGNEKITHPETEAILKMPKPIQTKFIKEVEKGTTIKEAVKKVDPDICYTTSFIGDRIRRYDRKKYRVKNTVVQMLCKKRKGKDLND